MWIWTNKRRCICISGVQIKTPTSFEFPQYVLHSISHPCLFIVRTNIVFYLQKPSFVAAIKRNALCCNYGAFMLSQKLHTFVMHPLNYRKCMRDLCTSYRQREAVWRKSYYESQVDLHWPFYCRCSFHHLGDFYYNLTRPYSFLICFVCLHLTLFMLVLGLVFLDYQRQMQISGLNGAKYYCAPHRVALSSLPFIWLWSSNRKPKTINCSTVSSSEDSEVFVLFLICFLCRPSDVCWQPSGHVLVF